MSREWKPGDLRSTALSRTVERIAVADRGHATPCWIPNYTTDKGGYVSLRADGRMQKMHRLTYEALVGPIPEGRQLDHLCRVRSCCNPAHLDPVSPRVNTLRGFGVTSANARKTHCIHGHEYTPENTAMRPDGSRKCIECRRRHRMAHYYRSRESA